MTTRKAQVLVALDPGLETAHQAYLKSLELAGLEVIRSKNADQLLDAAKGNVGLFVIGAGSKLGTATGLDLLRRLEELEPRPNAPVLLLHASGTPGAAAAVETSFELLNKWSEARERLGLGVSRSSSRKPKAEQAKSAVPQVKLESKQRTLELVKPAPREQATAPPVPPPSKTEETHPPEPTTEETEPVFAKELEISPPMEEPAPLPRTTGVDESTKKIMAPPADGSGDVSPEFRPIPVEKTEEMSAPPSFVSDSAVYAPIDETPSRTEELRRRHSKRVIVIALICLFLGAALATVLVLLFSGDSDGDGESVEVPAPPSEQVSAEVDAAVFPGEPTEEEPIVDAAQPDGGQAEEEELLTELPEELVLPFRFDRHNSRPFDVRWQKMRNIIELIKQNPETEFVLVGHASPDELPRRARVLGTSRAKIARDIICLKGPSRSRFEVRSAAAKQPLRRVAPGGRDLMEASRRVVLRVVER